MNSGSLELNCILCFDILVVTSDAELLVACYFLPCAQAGNSVLFSHLQAHTNHIQSVLNMPEQKHWFFDFFCFQNFFPSHVPSRRRAQPKGCSTDRAAHSLCAGLCALNFAACFFSSVPQGLINYAVSSHKATSVLSLACIRNTTALPFLNILQGEVPIYSGCKRKMSRFVGRSPQSQCRRPD